MRKGGDFYDECNRKCDKPDRQSGVGLVDDHFTSGHPYFHDHPYRCVQRKIGTAIRLSVTKDTNAEGEVSQFGALTTALLPLLEPEISSVSVLPLLLAVPVQSSGAGLPVSSESPPNTVSLSSL